MSGRPLTLDDIADARAYERERAGLRDQIIALKKIRRVGVGPVITLVFENRDTIRFQIQEMARAERIMSDAGIQTELDIYNPLIPGPGELSATLYIELTSMEEMEEWLPKLVGVECAVQIEIGAPDAAGSNGGGMATAVVRCDVDPDHEEALTREEVTAAVHYVHFSLSSAEVERFRDETVILAVDHPGYQERTTLSAETRASLLKDLLG